MTQDFYMTKYVKKSGQTLPKTRQNSRQASEFDIRGDFTPMPKCFKMT